jgi:hypothetical protein
VQIAYGHPRTLNAEGYRRLLTQATNHLLPLAHPPNDMRHAINSRRDARSNISASRDRRHENEIRRREEYNQDHGVPAHSHATPIESATASTNSPVWGRSRRPNTHSPPRDRRCNTLNLGVEFFFFFSLTKFGRNSLSSSRSAPSSQFQTSIVRGVRVMYKQNLSVMGVATCRSAFLCLMLRVRLVLSRFSVRDWSPFDGRAPPSARAPRAASARALAPSRGHARRAPQPRLPQPR